MSDFNLVCGKGLFLDVKYTHEQKPRYFIDIKKQICTCAGFMFTSHCKHFTKYLNKLRAIQLVWDETNE